MSGASAPAGLFKERAKTQPGSPLKGRRTTDTDQPGLERTRIANEKAGDFMGYGVQIEGRRVATPASPFKRSGDEKPIHSLESESRCMKTGPRTGFLEIRWRKETDRRFFRKWMSQNGA